MEEGLYKVTFETEHGQGSGIVALRGGRADGGDSTMFYTGVYALNDGRFSAELRVGRHTDILGDESLLGVNNAILNLSGTFDGATAQMTGTTQQSPSVSFLAILAKIAD